MEITVSLRGLALFVHNLFWWFIVVALLLKASWTPVVLIGILSVQTLFLVVYAFKGPEAIGITRSQAEDQASQVKRKGTEEGW